jgi:hypothetical protein
MTITPAYRHHETGQELGTGRLEQDDPRARLRMGLQLGRYGLRLVRQGPVRERPVLPR